MRKSPDSVVSPFFAWTDAVLTGGKRMLDAMQEAAKRGKSARVGVIPTADAPPRKSRAKGRAKSKARKARRR